MYCPANPVSALIGDETPIRFVLSAILKVGIYQLESESKKVFSQ